MDERPRYDEKLDRILRAAAEIFARKGFHQATIRDISAATGISLSGLYYYFRSKDELLYLIEAHCLAELSDGLHQAVAGIEDPEARLRAAIRNHVEYFFSRMHEMKVLSHEADSLVPPLADRIHAMKRGYVRLMRGVVEGLDLPAGTAGRSATMILFGMMNWVYTWHDRERDPSPAAFAGIVAEIFLHGFGGLDDPDAAAELGPVGSTKLAGWGES